ncbi:MAG: helix-turn-helix domain-containing protein [Actinophytocola sp.]|uniref:helix-turn-helix domain-containing protein n=1 Tax=Actinophytocola sp. TaxID=1872138 RepID=UPI003D6C439F
MHDHEPTVRSRELGLALSRAAAAKGLIGRELAELLGWSPSKISRLLSGKRGASSEDIAAFLAICGITGPKRDALIRLTRDSYEPSWWLEFGERLPSQLTTLSDYEDAAISMTQFESAIVPGLLQTESYIRALLHSNPLIPHSEIDDRMELRLRRQEIIDGANPTRFRFFIDEHMVTRTGPGEEIMSDQVHHLLRIMVRPYVSVRVVPDASGLHGGRMPFKLMEFTELNPVVFIENLNSVAFLEQKETIAGYRRIVADLDRVALDEGQSRAWLAELARALGRPHKERDELAIYGMAEEFPIGSDGLRGADTFGCA